MYRLVALLAVLGLLFAVAGCSSKPDAREQELRELRELQAEIPSYYLTAKEIGDDYKMLKAFYPNSVLASCIRERIPPTDVYASYNNYDVPGKHRRVAILVLEISKLDLDSYGDIVTKLSLAYDKECKKENMQGSKDGDTRWRILSSSRVEGLKYGGFGFRATEWWPADEGVIPYPPTQKQLETDERILANSGVYAYGRIGRYIVTVYISTDTREQPSEEELKRLWDLQVEKILKHIEKEK